jgi:hypothetical protein
MQSVQWLYVITSGSYSWGNSQSEISYEHRPVLNGYGAKGIWNSRRSEPYVQHRGYSCVLQNRKFDDVVPLFCLICVRSPCFSCNPTHGNLGRVRSGDRSGQFWWPPRPIHRSGNCSFTYFVTCRLKCGAPCHAGNTSVSVFCVVKIIFNLCPYLRNRWESDPCSYDISDCECTQE